jgi:hypothetical protein
VALLAIDAKLVGHFSAAPRQAACPCRRDIATV